MYVHIVQVSTVIYLFEMLTLSMFQVYDCNTGTQLKSYRGQPAAASTLCSVGKFFLNVVDEMKIATK